MWVLAMSAEPAGGRAGGKGGRGRGRGRKSHVHDAGPRFTHELLHRLEQISSLVADLVAAVKVRPSECEISLHVRMYHMQGGLCSKCVQHHETHLAI